MKTTNFVRWLFAAFAMTLSASVLAQSAVRISEFHYDNASTDSGEAIEVSAPVGTDLTGWTVVLYNGSSGTSGLSYDTRPLPTTFASTCGARGVVVLNYPVNGIQNGVRDGIALVNGAGVVVEFLSYEGAFAATDGPAIGMTAIDIGVSEPDNGPATNSLARNAAGAWSLGANTFGACNDDGAIPNVATVRVAPTTATVYIGGSVTLIATAFDIGGAPISGVPFTWSTTDRRVATVSATGVVTGVTGGDVVILATAANGIEGGSEVHVNDGAPPVVDLHINEIHYDNFGDDANEAIEIEGPAGANLAGFSIVLYNGSNGATYGTPRILFGTLPASCDTRGVQALSYPADAIQNGPDAIALVNPAGQVLEFLSYEGTFTATSGPAAGMVPVDIGVSQSAAAAGLSLQRNSANRWQSGRNSFGACNPETPDTGVNTLSFSGRVPSDPPLPVGYEDQLFATLRDSTNATVPTTITWVSETPLIASIDENGVLHALSEGMAIVRATAAEGTTATYSLPTRVAVASGVEYPGNTEFGEPADGDPIDDLIVRHEQFTASYNPNRGTPNWVSYDLDAAHFGTEDRCDCFTMDPDLPATLPRITTNDYTNSGAIAGYGIDRGHMTRSFDRTTGSLDNARTYLFSNVVPQAADLNQGPWARLETYLGNLAIDSGREVYVITGVAGNKGTLKNEGKVVIPTSTWKVAVVMAHDQGLLDIHDYRDLEVIAVNMPNDPGVHDVDWNTYRTTVDAIETLTGYNLLALLPDDVEAAVESNTKPPLASLTGPAGTIAEGSSATFDASGTIDPNGTIASYAWDFGDGSTGTGVSVAHTFTQDGAFTVTLRVTDNDGLTDTATFTLNVTNVAPVVGAVPDATLNLGATYTAAGTFTDPGADAWTATVLWGDGSAPEVVPLAGHDFSLTHIYTAGGAYTVTIDIADDDASAATSHTVTVEVPAPESGLADALPLIDELIATRKIPRAVGILWKAEVIAAQVLIGRGNEPAAVQVLKAEVDQIDLLVRCHVVKAADVAPLRQVLVDAIASLDSGATVRAASAHYRRHH